MLKDGDGNEHPIRIGLIGFVPPQIMNWDRRHLDGNVAARDIVATAKAYIAIPARDLLYIDLFLLKKTDDVLNEDKCCRSNVASREWVDAWRTHLFCELITDGDIGSW